MSPPSDLPAPGDLRRRIEAMHGQAVLIAADLVLDRFVHGSPKRISREAPVLILRHEGETSAPGGGANAVANIAALGGRPLVLGVVGDDAGGEALVSELSKRGVATDGVLRRTGYRTPTKTRVLAGGRHAIRQQVVRYDIEDEGELTDTEFEKMEAVLRRWQDEAGVAVLSDYGYGAVSPRLVEPMRNALNNTGSVICDSRHLLNGFPGIDGATPNEEEAEALAGEPLGEGDATIAERLRRKLGCRFLLVTRGSAGMCLVEEAGAWHLPVYGTDQVADVTGAGDTVIGAFSLALAAGATPIEAAHVANYAGGIVVLKTGTATPTVEELQQAVADTDPVERTRWEPF